MDTKFAPWPTCILLLRAEPVGRFVVSKVNKGTLKSTLPSIETE
jgi:hypothetical protein